MAIHFNIEENKVILEYFPQDGTKWIEDTLNEESHYEIKGVFKISNDDIYSKEKDFVESISFIIGELQNNYYKIYSRILRTKFDVLIHTAGISFKYKIFSFK